MYDTTNVEQYKRETFEAGLLEVGSKGILIFTSENIAHAV